MAIVWNLTAVGFDARNAQGQQSATTLTVVDWNDQAERQVVVDREAGVYLGHPSTCLVEDGQAVLIVYPKGHGRGEVVQKVSRDGGLTWSERLPVPDNWKTSREVPTLFRVADAAGVERVIMFSGLYPARLAVSEDEGGTWSPLEAVGDWGGIVVMGSLFPVDQKPGHYMAMFHDDGRYLRAESAATNPVTFDLLASRSTDGGLSWSEPESLYRSQQMHLCEPGAVRSPDGKELACLLRENSRQHPTQIIFSRDEGRTWSEPRAVPEALYGDRHVLKYADDGRLVISYRQVAPRSVSLPFDGDWVAWVGTYDDLQAGRDGEYLVRLKDNLHRWDCAYPGVEKLPDGTFLVATYGHWVEGESPFILSVRFRLEELDALRDTR